MLFVGGRFVSQLQIYKQYRVLIQMLKQSIWDMKAFTMILILLTFLMTLMNGILNNVNTFENRYDHFNNFLSNAGDEYQIIFGENPDPSE